MAKMVIRMLAEILFVAHVLYGMCRGVSARYRPQNESFNIPGIYSFGDSLFDSGNNHFNPQCGIQADFPPYGIDFFHKPTGRFTNGRTVVDFFSEYLHIPRQEPYRLVLSRYLNEGTDYPRYGINFASGGSGLIASTNIKSLVTPMLEQVQHFRSMINVLKIDETLISQSLFLVVGGSNDIFLNYFPNRANTTLSPEDFIAKMMLQYTRVIQELYELGARKIAIFGLGPIGCVPARYIITHIADSSCFEDANIMASAFNSYLENMTVQIPHNFPGTLAVYGSTYDVVELFRTSPAKFGFKVTGSACCGSGHLKGEFQCGNVENSSMCDNPREYLFWDFFHPSERAYKLLSKAFWGDGSSRIRPFNLKHLARLNLP